MKRIFSKEKSRKEKKADFYILYTIVFCGDLAVLFTVVFISMENP